VIDAKPAVKIQSASISPGIVIAPRAVVEVPMTDDGSTGSGAAEDTETASMVSGDEEVNRGEGLDVPHHVVWYVGAAKN
jgi:hypothetical protein